MRITIITACFNAIATIGDAIESVRRQRLPAGVELEHLIIDGGSTDGTEKLATLSEPDRGMYDAIDKGIRMATGDVIGILNADDALDGDDVLARVARTWVSTNEKVKVKSEKGDGGLDCLYGNVRFVNAAGRTTRVCFARFWKPWMLQWGYMPPHPGVFIRRACFEKWGAYVPEKTEYRIAADYELLIRFFRVRRMTSRYMAVCTTRMRPGGLSTRDVEARRKLNAEIIKGNRANGYFCIWPMLLPKYFVKMWEVILPRIGLWQKHD